MSRRMFVAVLPPPEVVADLADYVEPRAERDSPLRWSPQQNWHLTLAFMAAVADRDLDELVEQLAGLAGRRDRFELRLQGAGSFPNPARGKLLWTGVAGEVDQLERLSTGSRTAAVRAGVAVDGAKFRPHLTLARSNRPVEMTRWLRVFDLYAGPSWQVSEIALVQSQLAPGGSRYQVAEVFPLGAGVPEQAG
ncbi:RNA 2',3'-cyclic phosphodiesterase [Jatrophihabitans sp.]|uniref:RNA 2',3'-cyclic phosphodiesterase n=1 Tax=Jatrophihabitans sp. TaxID=1932789 RepID=UPI002C4559ED|nr:RNA 2',3'-cyclic phosphodiesterase [Jatrophihabitans sp.]